MSCVRTWLRSEDHYYWLTSYLAARGLQRSTCRLTAVNIMGLGLLPLIVMLSPVGPTGTVSRTLAVAVTICCAAMAAVWLRASWPTRLQSRSCVAIGSICISVACLIDAQPAVGLVGVSAYVVLSAFTALFHDMRLLVFTWAVGAATLAALADRLLGVDPLIPFCGVALFVLTNVFVVFICRNIIRLLDNDFHSTELEPLTGLLTREAFFDRVATQVSSRDRDDDRYVAMIVVSLDSFSLLSATAGTAGANRARVEIGHRIAQTLRRDAVLAHVDRSEFYIADTFTTANASVLTERLHQTIRHSPVKLTASIGVVTTPLGPLAGVPPHDVVEELLAIATCNLYAARRAGGQRTEATHCSRLTAVDNADDFDDDVSA